MAGLADLFGGGVNGLLSEDETGQLTNNALINAGLGILAASGPQQGLRRPSLGQALMQGLQSGSQAYQSGQKGIMANREMQRKMLEEKQARELMQSTAQGLGGPDKYGAYIEAGNKALAGGNIDLANKYFDIAKNFAPKERKTATVDNVVIDVETGKPIYEGEKALKANPTRERQVGRTKIQEELQKDGTWREIGRGAMDAPQQAQRASYSTFTGADGQVYRINSLTGQAEPVSVAGSGAPLTAPNKAAEAKQTRAQQAQGVVGLLNEAESIIPQATGSYLGAGADIAAEIVGASTKGAQNTAKLKAIEAGLILNMPRLEGPQSNLDQMLYREAAGKIGSATTPVKTKLAALETVKKIAMQNSQPQGQNILPKNATMPTSQAGGWSIKKKGN